MVVILQDKKNEIDGSKKLDYMSIEDALSTYDIRDFGSEEMAKEREENFSAGLTETVLAGIYEGGITPIKLIPSGGQMFRGRLSYSLGDILPKDWKISQNLKTVGEELVKTANLNYEQTKKQLNEYRPMISKKDEESLSYLLASGGASYGSMLLAGALTGGIGAISYAGLQNLTGTELQNLEKHKQEHPEDVNLEGFLEKGKTDLPIEIAKASMSAIIEKKLGVPEQLKIFKRDLNKNYINSKLKGVLKTGFEGYIRNSSSEFLEEFAQSTTDTGFDYLLGFYEKPDDAFKDILDSIYEAGALSIFGGVTGFGGAIYSRRKAIMSASEKLSNVVQDPSERERVATAFVDSNINTVIENVSSEISVSSQLKSEHGDVMNAMASAIKNAISNVPYFSNWSEQKQAEYVSDTAKNFANTALSEAIFRNTPVTSVINSKDIRYIGNGKIALEPSKMPKAKTQNKKDVDDSRIKYESIERKSKAEEALSEIQDATDEQDFVRVSGKKVPVKYEIVEADTLKTSHTPTGEENLDYPKFLQNRDRSRQELVDQVKNISDKNKIEPERLGKNVVATEGAPVVLDDGTVVAGNGRTNGIKLAYQGDAGQIYRDYLKNQGYNVQGMKKPVLVRKMQQRYSDEAMRAFIEGGNVAGTSQLSVSETALGDANKITSDLMSVYNPEYEIDNIENTQFLRTMFNEVVPEQERGRYLDQNNYITPAGVDRVQNAMLAYILPNNRVLSSILETKDDVLKKASNGILNSAHKIVALDTAIKNGDVKQEYSILEDLRSAFELYVGAKRSGQDLQAYINNMDMFSNVSDTSRAIADFFIKSRSSKAIKDFLVGYSESAMREGDTRQTSMFDQPLTREQIISNLIGRNAFFQEEYQEEYIDVNEDDKMLQKAKELYSQGVKNNEVLKKETGFVLSGQYDKNGNPKFVKETIRPYSKKELLEMLEVQNIEKNKEKLFDVYYNHIDKYGSSVQDMLHFRLKNMYNLEMSDLYKKRHYEYEKEIKIKEEKEKIQKEISDLKLPKKITAEQLKKLFTSNGFVVLSEYNANTGSYYLTVENKNKDEDDIVISLRDHHKHSNDYVRPDYDVFVDYDYNYSSDVLYIADKLNLKGSLITKLRKRDELVTRLYGAKEYYYQDLVKSDKKTVRRGSYDRDSKVIKLLSSANASTLPHEMAHYWLDNIHFYATSGLASDDYLNRYTALTNWLGKPEWSNGFSRKQHEKFASGYEKYLRTGNLPKPIIGDVFDDYDKWLKDVYKSADEIKISGTKEKPILTPDIIKFFQSMTSGKIDISNANKKIEEQAMYKSFEEETNKNEEETVDYVEKTPDVTISEPKITELPEIIVEEKQKPVKTIKEFKPVEGSGKKKKSSLYTRIMNEFGIEDKELRYEAVNLKEQQEKAKDMLKNDPEKVQRILDFEEPADNILRNSLYFAVQQKFLESGNIEGWHKSVSRQSYEATRAGQEISSLRRSMIDPDYWIRGAEAELYKMLAKKTVPLWRSGFDESALKRLNENLNSDIQTLSQKVFSEKEKNRSDLLKDELKKLQSKYKGLKQPNLKKLYQQEFENKKQVNEYVRNAVFDAVGLTVSNEKTREIVQLSNELKLLSFNRDDFGNPKIEFFEKRTQLEKAVNSLTPASVLRVLVGIIGRGNMLTAPATSFLGGVSSLENLLIQDAVRFVTNKIENHTNDIIVDDALIENLRNKIKDVFSKTGNDISMMNNLSDSRLYKGEKLYHSEGDGYIRSLGRFYEKWVFQKLISTPDVYFKSRIAFVKYLANEATDFAYKEGLTGERAKERANELFVQASKIEPDTNTAKIIREKAQQDSLIITFQNDTLFSKFLLKIRETINKSTGDIGIGDALYAFVKTSANIISIGYDAAVGPLSNPKNLIGAINDFKRAKNGDLTALKSNRIHRVIRSSSHFALAQFAISAILATMIDDDDYIPDYSQIPINQKDIVFAKSGSFGAVKIGNVWVNTDFFGALEIPLVARLNARRADKFLSSDYFSGYYQGIFKKVLDAPVLGDLIKQEKKLSDLKTPEDISNETFKSLDNFVSSIFVPNVVSTLTKIYDDYERETNREFAGRLRGKLPFFRQDLKPKMSSVTGETIKTQPAIVQILLGSRGHIETNNVIAKEAFRLSQKGLSPSLTSITKRGDLSILSDVDKDKIDKEYYKMLRAKLRNTLTTSEYRKLTDEDKKDKINKVIRDIKRNIKKKYKNKIDILKKREQNKKRRGNRT